jgi:hypothetical protein
VQTVLIGYAPSGQGWVGWVVLAAIVAFLAAGVFGVLRCWLKAGVIEWRSRRQVSSPPTETTALHSAGPGTGRPPQRFFFMRIDVAV